MFGALKFKRVCYGLCSEQNRSEMSFVVATSLFFGANSIKNVPQVFLIHSLVINDKINSHRLISVTVVFD